MSIDPHHLACLEAALDLALEAPRGPDGALTPEGEAHVRAALDQANGPARLSESVWPYGFSEEGWYAFAAKNAGRTPGEKWQGPSGRWFTMRPDRRIVPTSSPDQDRARAEKGKAREAAVAAKAKAAEQAKAAKEAAAKQKAALAAKKKVEAEAARAKAAAAKAKEQEKAKGQRRRAAEHIRDVASGAATTTPAKVKAAGAHLLNMTATELRALKSEIGAKGGGAAKAGLVAAITERALAARKAGKAKGKAPAASPIDVKDPDSLARAVGEVGPSLPHSISRQPLRPDAPAYERDGHKVFISELYDALKPRLKGAGLDQFKAALLAAHTAGKLSLGRLDLVQAVQDRGLGHLIPGSEVRHPAGGTFHTVNAGAPAGQLPGDQQAALEERKFTGTDRLGRKWVNGELVAKGEKPPAPDDRQRQIDFISDRLGKARAELQRAFPHGPQDSQGYRDRANQVAQYQAQLDALGGATAPPPAAPTSTADALRELQDARASTHHLPHQSMPLAELRDRLGLTDAQALDLARRLHREQGVTAETRSGDLLGQNGVADVVIPLGGVQPRHKAPATAEQVRAAVPKVEAAVREAAAGLPPGGQVKISDLRRHLGLGRHEFDSAMHALRRAGKVKLDAISNLQRATPGELADAIPGVNETLFYVEPVGGDAPGIPKPSPGGKGPDGHQEYTASDGSRVRAPAYDEDKIPADFALPDERQLLDDVAEAVADQTRKQGYAFVADVYDAVKASHPGLNLHDFHRQILAWGNRGLLAPQRTNDPDVMTPDQLAKSPALVSDDPTKKRADLVVGTLGMVPGWREHAPERR